MKVSMSHLKDGFDLVNGYIFYQCTDLSLGNRRYKNCSFCRGSIYTAHHDPGNDWKFGF